VNGKDVEVNEDVFKAYSQGDHRERYLVERDAGRLLSLEKFKLFTCHILPVPQEQCTTENNALQHCTSFTSFPHKHFSGINHFKSFYLEWPQCVCD